MNRVDPTLAQDPRDKAEADSTSAFARAAHRYLDQWLNHLEDLLTVAVTSLVEQRPAPALPAPPPFPPDAAARMGLGRLIRDETLGADEALLVTLALAPWVRPDLFDRAVAAASGERRDFEIIGGTRGKAHRGMLPTGDTALFLLAGLDTAQRLDWQAYLAGAGALMTRRILRLAAPEGSDPPMSGHLTLERDIADLILTGRHRIPPLSPGFPATRLTTRQTWEDLVLPQQTMAQVRELIDWTRHKDRLLDDWGMRRTLRPGCRVLFYGPPGTGKTLTATLIGAQTGQEVLRVDLSMVVSKYIGETEKNLAAVFDRAEHKDWMLFFDEADALFGKRSSVKEAKDRYANQEIAFLLQRIETYAGMVVLCSNLVGNVDAAFSRRFEHMIHFPMPRAGERLKLWQQAIPLKATLDPAVDLRAIAEGFELSGASILNVVRHAALAAVSRDSDILTRTDIDQGIRRELAKEGRSR